MDDGDDEQTIAPKIPVPTPQHLLLLLRMMMMRCGVNLQVSIPTYGIHVFVHILVVDEDKDP